MDEALLRANVFVDNSSDKLIVSSAVVAHSAYNKAGRAPRSQATRAGARESTSLLLHYDGRTRWSRGSGTGWPNFPCIFQTAPSACRRTLAATALLDSTWSGRRLLDQKWSGPSCSWDYRDASCRGRRERWQYRTVEMKHATMDENQIACLAWE